MIRVLFFTAVTATLLPYIYNRTEYRLLSYIIAVAAIIGVTSMLWLDRRMRSLVIQIAHRSSHFLLYCALILVSQSVSTLLIPELGVFDYVWALGYIFGGLIAYFVFPTVIWNGMFKKLLGFLIFVGAFSSAIAVYVAFTGAKEVLGFHIRQVQPYVPLGIYATSSIFYNANRFGPVAFFGLLGSLYFIWERRYILVVVPTLFLCAAGVVVSWNRGIYLGFALAFSVWLVIITKPSHRYTSIGLLTLLTITGVFTVAHVRPLNAALLELGLAKREILWPAMIQLIMERPLAGYGFGRAEIIESRVYSYTGSASAAHSAPLSIAFHGGIPLALLYLMIFWISLRRLQRSKLGRPEKATVMAGMTGLFVAALFSDYTPGGVAYATFLYTIFLGLANASPWLSSMRGARVRILTERGRANGNRKPTIGFVSNYN